MASFNTQPPEGGCIMPPPIRGANYEVSTHSRPKAAAQNGFTVDGVSTVSTHSRPKAAADNSNSIIHIQFCFNTQPPEGGCCTYHSTLHQKRSFNTQPPEGGCPCNGNLISLPLSVSTHSRPKAAAPYIKKQEKSVY